jgi:glycosyltransferase involved in cell wall biosynthesis/putative flippase GtrA
MVAAMQEAIAPATAPVVDVVVPVHDEEATLDASIRRLHEHLVHEFPFTWRITIVDNASTDRTWTHASRLAAELDGVRAMHLDRKGRGLALREAWTSSDARIVAYTDVDLSTDLDALLPLVAPLVSGHSDVSIGSRLAPGSSVARGPKRELISRAYNLILRTVLATRVHDAQCGFKAVRADVARRLVPAIQDDGWFFDTELLVLAERNGLRILEVPVDWVDDPDSRVHIAKTACGDLAGTWRLVRTFAAGGGRVDLGPAARADLDDDFGRRLVSFGTIGAVSTLVSLVLFLLLQAPIGAIPASIVAVTATFVANTWANARCTVRTGGPNWPVALAVYTGSLLLSAVALSAVLAAGGGLAVQVVVLVATWMLAALVRLLTLQRAARAERVEVR